jgi:hypothetical protein
MTRFADALLWPGTKVCERLGIDPNSDAGLIRWMVNTLFYLVVGLAAVWMTAVCYPPGSKDRSNARAN